MKNVNIKQVTEEEFRCFELNWQSCLMKSAANPLFSSWAWQFNWWRIWQPRLNLSLLLLGIYDNAELIGIVPCYTYQFKHSIAGNVTRCEFIGSYSQNDDSVRSEYLNFIFPKNRYNDYLTAVFHYIKSIDVDEIVLLDLDQKSETAKYLRTHFNPNCSKKDIGIKIDCNNTFEHYLSKLGKNTRLKMYSRRKILISSDIFTIKTTSDIELFFKHLNLMHEERWGRVCFSSHSLEFHRQIASYFLASEQLCCRILYQESEAIAVAYDICVGGVRYNIQLGFYTPATSKMSIGTLMLGFAIEEAHNSAKISYYDLLAGSGKNSFYKEKFKGNESVFVSYSIPFKSSLKFSHLIRRVLFKIKQTVKKNSGNR